MGGRNYGICHTCRNPGHWLEDCPVKKRFPKCGEGFVRLLEVEKICDNRGKLFLSCTRFNCRYYDWQKGDSNTGAQIENKAKTDIDDELSRLMKTCARIANEDDIEINVITLRKSKGSVGGKGKEKMEDS